MAAVRLYVDTNIFIYAFENNDALAKKLLQLISLNDGRKQTADTRLKETYSIAPNRLVPPQMAIKISIMRQEISALDRVVAEVEP
ncbi:hypothetical protein NKH69_16255 [Mesorhizobium sp. M0976]|uniref:hypothetical protein n=1 Tax=unclassified Mesorhizobium TaxID=325217 RepID=UPI00333C59BE